MVRKDVEAVVSSLTRANTQEAAFRKLVILQTFSAVGRGGEVAATTVNQIEQSRAFLLHKLLWYNFKTNKFKPAVILPAFQEWSSDLMLAYADATIFGQLNLGGPSLTGDNKFIFPQLAKVRQTATKISKMLQDHVTGANSQYHPVQGLTPGVSSHSLRHGGFDEMDAHGVEGSKQSDAAGHAHRGEGSGGSGGEPYHNISDKNVIMGEQAKLSSLAACLFSSWIFSFCSRDGLDGMAPATSRGPCSRA